VEQAEQDLELRRERVDVQRMGDVDVDVPDEEPAARRA
jgi:hypothetical protein